MISTGTHSLGEGYALVWGDTQRYVTVSMTSCPGDVQTELVRKEAKSRYHVSITIGPWKPESGTSYRAQILTAIPSRRG